MRCAAVHTGCPPPLPHVSLTLPAPARHARGRHCRKGVSLYSTVILFTSAHTSPQSNSGHPGMPMVCGPAPRPRARGVYARIDTAKLTLFSSFSRAWPRLPTCSSPGKCLLPQRRDLRPSGGAGVHVRGRSIWARLPRERRRSRRAPRARPRRFFLRTSLVRRSLRAQILHLRLRTE